MRSERGFTLIEIMVALAVFSLAVLALLRLESATVRGAGLIDESMVAQMVARNVALDALTEAQPPAPGRTSGAEVNGGRAWRWTRQVSPTGDPTVVRIDVAVASRSGQIVGRIMMIRPPSAAAPVVGAPS
ncbi:type II secretion system minor pseudopilin GspI [Sphingomonas sp. Leaf339]|uniref:type II secretion system minor pseudopilin GspI n=1 Tax=Sphingomonas sp. Leaf339 TaxID=1736343 RepID=UPI000A83EFA8|nr:type II secretion system minor pseudopilin GspI [Sphingomonas sp. Leaf339]